MSDILKKQYHGKVYRHEINFFSLDLFAYVLIFCILYFIMLIYLEDHIRHKQSHNCVQKDL